MSYITVPLLANYKISDRWKIVAGPYFSYMIDGDFSGDVYEGHLRTPDATGSRIDFEGENSAAYDFLISCAISNGEFKWEEAGKRTSTSPYMPT